MSDHADTRFGMREISYELSLMDTDRPSAPRRDRPRQGPSARPGADRRDARGRPQERGRLGRLADQGGRDLAGGEAPAAHAALALPRDQGQRREDRRPRRQLGHGRLHEAGLARAAGALLPPAPRRQHQHHQELGRPGHRGRLLRPRRRVRPADLQRFLGLDPGMAARGRGRAAVPEERRGRDQALPQPSVHRDLVRPQRGRAAAGAERGAREAGPRPGRHALLFGQLQPGEPAGLRSLQLP